MIALDSPRAPFLLGIAMAITAAGATLLRPGPLPAASGPRFADVVPRAFGDWKEITAAPGQVDPASTGQELSMDRPYDDVLMRAYANSSGEVVLLALAYGRNQRQEIKIHRPEVCYTAQGFELVSRRRVELPIRDSAGRPIAGTRMLVQAPGRIEAVSYWIRVGELYTDDAWAIRYHIFRQGMTGRSLDGVLVRASQIIGSAGLDSAQQPYRVQERFLAELVRAMPAAGRQLLIS
jgi:EpsI family protein